MARIATHATSAAARPPRAIRPRTYGAVSWPAIEPPSSHTFSRLMRPSRNDHLLGLDVRGEELVEALRGVGAVQGAQRGADEVVLDVVGVHRHRGRRVSGGLGPDVLGDQLVHLLACHSVLQMSYAPRTAIVRVPYY
jgi:hypothetical protein